MVENGLKATKYLLGCVINIQKPDVFESICLKTIKTCVKILVGQSHQLYYFDGNDGANQCHHNSLFVVLIARDKFFLEQIRPIIVLGPMEICTLIETMPNDERRKLKFLALNLLRYLPHNQIKNLREHVRNLTILELNEIEQDLMISLFKKPGSNIGLITSLLCSQLIQLRLDLVEEMRSNSDFRDIDPFPKDHAIETYCFEINRIKNVLPKFPGIYLFIKALNHYTIPVMIESISEENKTKWFFLKGQQIPDFSSFPPHTPVIKIMIKGQSAPICLDQMIIMNAIDFMYRYQQSAISTCPVQLQKQNRSPDIEIIHITPFCTD